MTHLERGCLILAAASLAGMLLVAFLAVATDSHSPQAWTVPPSAVRAITAAPGEQREPEPAVLSAGRVEPAATASPRLPRWSAEPKPAMELGPGATARTSPTPGAAASHSLAELVFTGIASTYGPGWDPRLVALPQGPGVRFRVCGQAACLVLVSTDKGPDQRIFPDRIVDLPVWAFERVSGQPWRRGITSVSVTILGGTR